MAASHPASSLTVTALRPYPNPPARERVRAVIMGDGQGEVQVLAPEHALLDVLALQAATGRNLQPRAYHVEEPVSAVPGAFPLPTLLDESLLAAGKLALATSDAGVFVQSSADELRHPGTAVAAFCLDLGAGEDPTPGERAGDRDRIDATLSKFTAARLQARIDETLHIPPLPEAARRIVALQADPNFDLSDLVQIVETDPSIAARIMGWANSAFYHPNPPASTLNDAVMRVLGLDTVMSMALGMSLGQTLRLPEAQVRGLPPFWLEAVFTAAAMEAIARHLPRAQRPESGLCYLAGLLANFGVLVVGHVFPHQYATICLLQEANRHLPHTHVDQHVLQMPRELLTAALLECWSLPEPVTDAVRFQYLADYQGPNQTYVRLLKTTRKLLGNQGLTDQPAELPDAMELEALGLDTASLRAVLALLEESRGQLDDLSGAMAR